MSANRTYSIDQAAHLLKVSRRTIYNMIRDGRLLTIETLGHTSQRVTEESMIRQGWIKPTPASAVPEIKFRRS